MLPNIIYPQYARSGCEKKPMQKRQQLIQFQELSKAGSSFSCPLFCHSDNDWNADAYQQGHEKWKWRLGGIALVKESGLKRRTAVFRTLVNWQEWQQPHS